MQPVNSLIEWSIKHIHLFVLLTVVAVISGIVLIVWQRPAETTETSVTVLIPENVGESHEMHVNESLEAATGNIAREFSPDTRELEDLSPRLETLVNQFFAEHQTLEDVDLVAAELGTLLDEQTDLLQHLLSREFPTQQQKNRLLESVSYFVDDTANSLLRDYALGLSRSSDHSHAMAGLELLSSMDIPIDSEVAQHLLEFGHSSQEPEVLTRVMATLTSASAPVTERDSIIEFINEMTGSEDPSIRSLAVQRLAQWDNAGSTGNTLSTLSLSDPNPAVRAFSIQALVKTTGVYQEQRDQLLTLVTDPQESPMVKIAAAEALDKLHLTASDIEIINDALWAEDFQLDARP